MAAAQEEADAIVATARSEASEIKAAAIAALREANDLRQAAEGGGSADEDARALAAAETAAAQLAERTKEIEDREFALDAREKAITLREQQAEDTGESGGSHGADVYAIPVAPRPSSDQPTNGNGHGDTQADSLESIRREALAALQASRTDGWDEPRSAEIPQEAFASATVERPSMDYSPSVPHPTPASEVGDENDDDAKPAEVESRYSRNSAKLPRIGIDPSTASNSIANLRKHMKQDD